MTLKNRSKKFPEQNRGGMNTKVKSFLSFIDRHISLPPNLLDEVQARTGRLLSIYLWTFMITMTTGCFILILLSPEQIFRPLSITLTIDSLYLTLWILIKRGWGRLANILTIGITWFLLTGAVLTGGGVHSAAYAGYFILTFLTGITLGGRSMVLVAVLSGFAGLGMEFFESNGLLPAARYQFTPFRFTIIQSIMLFILVLLQYYASWIVKQAQKKARDELNERMLTEQALSASQQRFAAIFENSPIPTALTQADNGHLLDVNPMWLNLSGFTREEVIGKNVLDLGVWSKPEDRAHMIEMLKTQDYVHNFETLLCRKDKVLRNISVSVRKTNLNGIDCLVFQTLDITEKLALERSLFESNERFNQIAMHIPQVFWISERIGGLSYVSPAYETIFGRTINEIFEGDYEYIDMILPEDRPIVQNAFELQLRGEPTQVEYRISRPNGTIRTIHDRSFPVFDAKGQLLRVIGVATDITEQKQAESERRELIATLEDAEQQVGLASWSHDVLTGKDKWSPRMFTLFGFDPHGSIPSIPEYLERIHPEDRAILGGVILKMMEGGIESKDPFIYRTNPEYGEMRILQPSYRLERGQNGQTVKFYGTVLDITERTRAEAEVYNRQQLLEKVIHAGKNITAISDFDRCLREIHHNVITNLGFDRVGLFLYDKETNFIRGTYGTDRNGKIERNDWYQRPVEEWSSWDVVLKNPKGISLDNDFQTQHNLPQESEMHGVKQHVTIAAWVGETPVALITVDNLMTQRTITPADLEALQLFAGYAGLAIENARMQTGLEKLVEQRTNDVRRSEATYRALFEESNDGIFLLSSTGKELQANQHVLDMLGYTHEEYLEATHNTQNPFTTDADQRVDANEKLAAILRGEQIAPYERILTKKDGQKIHVEINLSPIRDETGKIIMIQSLVRDITQRKKVEETLRQANLEMARALRMKDEFLANMSHELRTPLNAILGLSESLLDGVGGSTTALQQKYLNIIRESGVHLLELINDILDLAKIESGQIQLNLKEVNIRQICEASLRIVDQLAKKKHHKMDLFIADGDVPLLADERHLKQMIVNLLSNAIKFTPNHGTIAIKVATDPAHNMVSIEVSDTGIGVKEEDLERLFKPFVQLDSGLARESSGTGLGLALVAQMVRLHGGGVKVISEIGKGSNFILSLPLTQAMKKRNTPNPKAATPGIATQDVNKNNSVILIAEDTESAAMMIKDFLEAFSFTVVSANNGADAIAKANTVHPDLILMDVQMPGMDGIEATRILRQQSEFQTTPILALTALAMTSDREQCLAAGMNDYISKPVVLRELLAIIQNHLKRKEAPDIS